MGSWKGVEAEKGVGQKEREREAGQVWTERERGGLGSEQSSYKLLLYLQVAQVAADDASCC